MSPKRKVPWDSDKVKRLRRHLGYTQTQLSDELGVRQQTVSDWETGVYAPRGASATLLRIVAEQAGFEYGVGEGAGGESVQPEKRRNPNRSDDHEHQEADI